MRVKQSGCFCFGRSSGMICNKCQTEFSTNRSWQKYCSKTCAKGQYKSNTLSEAYGVDRSLVGAIGELKVANDLLQKGYYVFRSVSHHSPFDLFAYCKRTGRSFRIEVSGGMPSQSGISYDKHSDAADHFDVIAIALFDKIVYLPDIL